MDKKGQISVFFLSFIAIIVGVTLLVATANITSDSVNTRTITNLSVTTAAVNSTVALTGRENISAVTIRNSSNDDISSQFTITTTDSNGNLAILLKTSDAAVTAGNDASLVNASYDMKPSGYVDNAAGRTMLNLVLVFAALAIFATAYNKGMFSQFT